MANRTVSVILQAEIGQYVSGMTKAAAATKGVGESAETSTTKASKGFDLAGKGALLMGGVVVGALAGIIAKSMDFEKSMSAVQAATQASASTMDDLRAAAIRAGADTQYSATEAADAITEMAKAGVSAKDIMGGGLKGALNLAAAGQLDVADAAGIASTAMTQFNLKGADLPHVADLLAAGAGKAMGSVDDMGQALNQAGLLASSAGISIEETTGTLAAFASAGLIGSDAGTSFKTMLQQLQNPTLESKVLMKQLGISAYDTQGNFVGLADLAQQLKDHLGNLTQAQRDQAIAQIFGSDAARAATVLYKEGAAGIEDWTGKVNDAGYAQKQAAQLTDNLSGDIERLGGSFDTLLISIGQGLMGPLRGLTQMLGGLVDGAGAAVHAFGNLPGPLQAGIGALGAMAVLNGPLSGVLGTLRNFGGTLGSSIGGTFTAFGEAMGYARANGDGLFTVLKSVGSYAAGGLKSAIGGLVDFFGGPFGLALAAIVTSYGLMVNASKDVEVATVDITQAQQGFTQALRESNGAIDENVRHAAAKAAQDAGVLDLADKAGVSLSLVTDGLTGNSKAYQTVSDRLHDYADAQRIAAGMMSASTGATVEQIDKAEKQAAQAQATADAFDHLSGTVGQTAATQKQLAEATSGSADAATTAAAQTAEASAAAQKAYDDWIKSMAEIGSAFVEPLAIYQEQLQTAAQATADSTSDAKDSWKDYADSATISLDQFATKLQEQITNQENWRANLVIVAQRAGYDVATQLEAMGVQGAGLVAQFANATDEQLQNMGVLMRQDAANGSTGAAQALDSGLKVMAAVGAAGAGATAAGISAALNMGINDVAAIAAQYGVTLATGFEPVLGALGKQVHLQVGGATRRGIVGISADGNLYENHQAEIAPGGVRIWAEPETGGEAYIPLAPSKRARSLSIWQETGKRLGVQAFANGGVVDPVQWGEVSGGEWRQLLAQGWKGRPGDRMEALYPPGGFRGFSASQGWVGAREVPRNTWDLLLAMGWRGRPGDHKEAVYPPSSWHRGLGGRWMPPGYADGGISRFADGGFMSPSDVPRPSSTAPYGSLVAFPADATMSTEYDTAVAWLKKNMMASGDPGGAGVQRWAPLVLRALSMMGQPAGLLDVVLRRMNQESGGNPRAINLTDINAKRGTPSKGLMQTIDPTFRANHFPGTSMDVYDPLANILASMKYALARYGSLAAAYNKMGGYETGTSFVPETGPAVLHKGEAVLTREQGESYRAGLRSRETSGASGSRPGAAGPPTVTINARVLIGDRELTDIVRVEATDVVVSYADAVHGRGVY